MGRVERGERQGGRGLGVHGTLRTLPLQRALGLGFPEDTLSSPLLIARSFRLHSCLLFTPSPSAQGGGQVGTSAHPARAPWLVELWSPEAPAQQAPRRLVRSRRPSCAPASAAPGSWPGAGTRGARDQRPHRLPSDPCPSPPAADRADLGRGRRGGSAQWVSGVLPAASPRHWPLLRGGAAKATALLARLPGSPALAGWVFGPGAPAPAPTARLCAAGAAQPCCAACW